MKNDNKNLGRGLAAFFEASDLSAINGEFETSPISESKVEKINVNLIDCNPYQPRKVFNDEAINELASSIIENGVIQPILVQSTNDGRFIVIAGERRLRATKLAGLTEIPCIVNVPLTDKKLLEIAILENIQRENLDILEEAEGYQKLIDNFSYTQEQLANKLGKSRSHITNILRLNLLPDQIKQLIHENKILFGHARALIGIPNSVEIAQRVVEESLSVRELEKLIQNQKIKIASYKNKGQIGIEFEDTVSETKNLETQLSDLLGLQVNLKMKQNKGSIEIKFKNLNELDSLLKRFN